MHGTVRPTRLSRPTRRLLGSFGVGAFGAGVWSEHLTAWCARYEITSRRRLALFLANVAHETGRFRFLSENFNYSAEALFTKFGPRRGMTREIADRLGRPAGSDIPVSPENQQQIANIIYGGEWGRRNLGNIEPGDGWLFRGRGGIHKTGRANVTRFAADIGRAVDDVFLTWLTTPGGACESAAHFWAIRGCNRLADSGLVDECRRRINGGDFGLDQVREFNDAFLHLIGLDETMPASISMLR